ncbi:MAG TPA: YceI family protein [Xanthomonadaceae bacterium]|nr:YceI family protein [Xanthomonadaceae bacterium]
MSIVPWLLALAAVPAYGHSWEATEASELRFAGVGDGERFEGRFAEFSARIDFDPGDPAACRFEVEVQLRSADTRNAERDEALMGEEFFAAQAHPLARWQAQRCRCAGQDGFVAEGTLQLKGHSAPVELRFQWTDAQGRPTLEGRARLDRMEFAVGTGDWNDPDLIAHEVEVRTRLTLRPAESREP